MLKYSLSQTGGDIADSHLQFSGSKFLILHRAIDAFLRGGDTCYVRDRRPEYYYITQHWGGYLYKKRRCGAAGAAETLE